MPMAAVYEVPVPVKGVEGGILWVRLLPGRSAAGDPRPLLDLRHDSGRDRSLEPVQLLENVEYRFEFVFPGLEGRKVTTDRPEVFQWLEGNGAKGLLRPGLRTGTLTAQVMIDDRPAGQLALEVRSAKLNYLTDYRTMLEEIADTFAEVIMERFAPTEQSFELDMTRDAPTLYQRFAFLRSLLAGDAFDTAMHLVISRPHRMWVEEEVLRIPGAGLPPGSAVAKRLAGPGPRTKWDRGRIRSLPALMPTTHMEETLDTPENRFIKFALTRWRAVVEEIGRALERGQENQSVIRGKNEVADLIGHLDEYLSADLFREVGEMLYLPASSQVLQKRAGYREVLRTYIQFEAAAALSWNGGEDVYAAGQRDVATLYEYWVYLQVAQVVSQICERPLDLRALVTEGQGGLGLGLKQGRGSVLKGTVNRLGRTLYLELWYNRTFSRAEGGAWSRPMRPDCSLLVRPTPAPEGFEETWLHFDAKYRVEDITSLFGAKRESTAREQDDLDAIDASEKRGTAKRTDLLKMHAYRDAIRKSAGAYVIYPGTEADRSPQYHELIPGLGAFVLRPSSNGEAGGSGALEAFLQEAFTHVASQVTQYERSRYWERQVFGSQPAPMAPQQAATFLVRPPADTRVLLGYVKSAEHLEWIRRERLYNLRADGRRGSVGLNSAELAAELVVLYGMGMEFAEVWPVLGEPVVVTRAGLVERGYPGPGGKMYFCLRLGDPVPEGLVPRMSGEYVEAVRQRVRLGVEAGGPVGTTWLTLLQWIPT
jgi:predicted component of viral defense system (DUF524 family)